MTKFLFDLYAMAHEFYRKRENGSPKPLAEGVCVITCFFFLLNMAQLTKLITNSNVPFPWDSRSKIVMFALPTMGVIYLFVRLLIWKAPAAQSPRLLHDYSLRLTLIRKVTLLGAVAANFILVIVLAEILHS